MDRYVPAVAKPKPPTEDAASGGGGGGGGGALRGERAMTVDELLDDADPELDDGFDGDDGGGGGGESEDDDDGTSWLDSQVRTFAYSVEPLLYSNALLSETE